MTIHLFPGKERTSPTARLRGYLLAEHLIKTGWDVIVHEPPIHRSFMSFERARFDECMKHIKLFRNIGNNDVIYLVRTVFQLDFVIIIFFFRVFYRRKVVFDFDDTIYLKKFCRYRSRLLTRAASAVVVGNEYLRDWVRARNPKVFVIPTAIPFKLYQQFTRPSQPASNQLVIGWSGHATNHVKNLRLLVPVFERLISAKISFEFTLVGGMKHGPVRDLFSDLKNFNINIIDSVDWDDPRNIAELIKNFDIGVMPLVKDEKTEGKCALKAIEYMACAVPAIVSPVGASKSLIEDGIDGWKAKNTDEWVSIITHIYRNPDVLSEVGRKAQDKVKNYYSYDAITPLFKHVIECL